MHGLSVQKFKLLMRDTRILMYKFNVSLFIFIEKTIVLLKLHIFKSFKNEYRLDTHRLYNCTFKPVVFYD